MQRSAEIEADVTIGVARELRLPARPSQLRVARDYAREVATAFGLDTQARYAFVYAVNEAVTNAIRHGAPDEQGLISLRVVVADGRLTLSVSDSGTFLVPPRDDAAIPERGRGFQMMASLVDEVHLSIESGGTTVSLSTARLGARTD